MSAHRPGPIDCVEMKRRIQQRIHAEDRGMAPDEFVAWFHRRVATSRFAARFCEQPLGACEHGEE